jgi:hypothetical protein
MTTSSAGWMRIRDDQVEIALERPVEEGVGRQRAFDFPAAGDAGPDRRLDLRLLLAAAEEAGLAGVRVDAAHGDAGVRDAGADDELAAARDRALDQSRVDPLDGVEEADVRGHVDHVQPGRHEHQGDLGGAGQGCEELRVAGEPVAGGVERLLVDRRGADRVDLARAREGHRPLDEPVRRFATGGREHAERRVLGYQGEIDAIDRADFEPRLVRRLDRVNGKSQAGALRCRASRRASPITRGRAIA